MYRNGLEFTKQSTAMQTALDAVTDQAERLQFLHGLGQMKDQQAANVIRAAFRRMG